MNKHGFYGKISWGDGMIYNLTNVLSCFAETLIIYFMYGAFIESKEKRIGISSVLAVGIVTVAITVSGRLFDMSLLNAFAVIVMCILAAVMQKGSVGRKLLIGVLVFSITVMAECISCIALAASAGTDINTVITDADFYALQLILSRSINMFCCVVIILRAGKRIGSEHTELINMTVIFAAAAGMLIEIMLVTAAAQLHEFMNSGMTVFVCMVLVIVNCGIMFYLYAALRMQKDEEVTRRLLEQQMQSQVRHFDEMLQSQTELRAVRHDMKNHMLALRAYLKSGEYTKGLAYIDRLDVKINGGGVRETGNIVIDTIISAKKSAAEQKNIRFESSIAIPENLDINASDICVVLGNALDNAIEACEKLDGEKYIRFNLVYSSGTLMCEIANPIRSKNHSLATTKADKANHGIGLGNIKAVLESYDCVYDISQENSEFILSFAIFCAE